MTFRIDHLDDVERAKLLQALYKHATSAINVALPTVSQCMGKLSRATYVDYFSGRPIKCDLGGDVVDTYLYERDNGRDAALAAFEEVGLEPEPEV